MWAKLMTSRNVTQPNLEGNLTNPSWAIDLAQAILLDMNQGDVCSSVHQEGEVTQEASNPNEDSFFLVHSLQLHWRSKISYIFGITCSGK